MRYVLVVDDDADLRESIADVLRDEGCRVYAAADGEEAMDFLRGVVPDLVITDLMMPRMNGWELCELLRRDRRLATTPIAVLSAFVDVQPVEGARVFRKPIDVHALMSLLDIVGGVERPAGGSSPPPSG